MLRSLFAGISGMRVNQTMLDVTGNNIANANTVGFKSSSTVFQDTLSQMLTASSAPSATRGGTNPLQIGLGVQLSTVKQSFTQGSNEVTGVGTDMMINGDGFFILQSGGSNVYTRAGAFTFDASGNLVAPDGKFVMGYAATNYTNTPGEAPTFTFSYGDLGQTGPTWTGVAAGSAPADYTITLPDGTAINLDLSDDTDGNGITDMNDIVAQINGTPVTDTVGATWTASYTGGQIRLQSDLNGLLSANGYTPPAGPPSAGGPYTVADKVTLVNNDAADTQLGIDPTGVTVPYSGQFVDGKTDTPTFASGTDLVRLTLTSNATALSALNPNAQLQSYEIGSDGVITGTYDDGSRLAIGRIAIADFANPEGLTKVGDTQFQESPNSGRVQYANAGAILPGIGQTGTLTVGSLEMSNVDLASEFTNLILAQRGFEASTKVITTSDQVLSDLVNIIR
jgi:flagellar hook protein FlgE